MRRFNLALLALNVKRQGAKESEQSTEAGGDN